MRAIILAGIFIVGLGLQPLCGQINADFSSSNLKSCGNLQTTFFDQSTSASSIITWAWDLGGNTSSKQNPGAIFTEPGQYTICLTVTDVDGNSDTECKEDYITILPNPIANFTSDITEGCAPITVTYSDLSTSENGIISWLWDIGGTTGVINTQDSSHIISSAYSNGGNYSASLTIEDSLGCTNTMTIPNFINVFKIPEPEISFELLSSCQLPWEVQFVNNNIDPTVTYIWDFGNGTTFEGSVPPAVKYFEVGAYDINIYMSSGDCRDTLSLTNYIDTDVTASFTYEPTTTCENAPIQFTDRSVIEAESVFWNFGDGTTSTAANPAHVYEESGCFDVTLIRFAGECSDTVVVSCLEILPTPEVEINIENQFNCTLPTAIVLSGEATTSGSFLWEFVNGSNSIWADSNNVPIVIEEFGSYMVNVTYTDDLGCSLKEESIPVDIFPFEANLPSVGPSGCVPLTFSLSDSITSQVDIVRWGWSVGDPVFLNSSSSNPSFTIQDTGKYDVMLVAENINGCIDTVVVEDYIKVGMIPEVDFVATPLESCVDVQKQFTDLSSEFADEWEWQFGQFGASDEQNPLVIFGYPGVFDIGLTVSHNGCSNSILFEDYITILEPISRFDVEYNCEDPFTVNVVNTSIGVDSLLWTLHLSETDSIMFTDSIFGTYTFPDRGNYVLSLYSTSFETGCEHTRIDTVKIVDPIASYTLDTLRGCAPLEINLGDFSQDAFTYEYVTNAGTIDSIYNSEPTITFTEGGIINGPLLIITDIHECKDSFQLMDSVVINRLDAMVDFPDVICIPEDVDLIDNSLDVLGNKISWKWNVGNGLFESTSQDTTIYIDSVGQYHLFFKVKDDWGCEDSLFIPSAINAVEIVPDFKSDTLGCTTAPISFMAQGDNGFIDFYEWDFGDGNTSSVRNPNHNYAQEGTYSVCLTMGDTRGCVKTICKENIIRIIDPSADFVGDPIFATCPPLLTNFENNSEDAISYTWDFGDNSGLSQNDSPSHVYTSPGAFDVTLIAQSTSKCFDTLLIEDYVRVEGPSGDFTFNMTEVCIPITVELFAQSDGLYAYTWDYGNGVLDSVPGLVLVDTTSYTYTETGKFTPKLIITDSIGCSRSFAGDPIIVNEVNLEFLKDTEPLCGPPLDVILDNISSGSTDDVSYTWFLEGPQNYTSSDSSPVFSVHESGVYNVSLVAAFDNCIDTITKPDFLEIADIPEVSFEIIADQFCEDVNAQFLNTSTVGYGDFVEWYWDFGDSTSATVENPIHQYTGEESRTITLTGITDKGCEDSFTSSFDVLPSMLAKAGEDQLICIGDEIDLNGEVENLLEGGSFYWQQNPTLSCLDCLNPTANPQFTSMYIMVAIHPNGCESQDTVQVTVVPIPGPELSLTSDSIICLGDESIITVDNFNPAYDYFWDEDVIGQNCYKNCEEVIVNPEEETTYYVTVFNEFGCFKSDSVTIEIESSFVEFIPDTRGICEGESTTIEITAGNNPKWNPDPDINCLTCPEVEVSPSQSKKYFLSVESDQGCIYHDSVEVLVVPENILFAGSDHEICLGESVQLNASGVGEPQWYPSEIVKAPSDFNTSAIPEVSGYISLMMTFDECSQTDSFYVEVHTQAEITTVGDSICAGEVGKLTAQGRADNYTWLLNDGSEVLNPELEMIADETEYFQVIAEFRTCNPDTSEAMLYVYPKIDYSLPEDFYTLHLNDEVRIEPVFDESRNYLFDWSPETGLDCMDCAAPRITGLMEHMEYSLIVKDEDSGCENQYEINVRFQNECTQNVFHLPNIFSPNGDGNNEEFSLTTDNPEEFISMSVFDRWGNLLFITDDIKNGWNGTIGGTKVQPGVYVYRINLICPFTNENYVVLGDVTVIY